MTNFDDDFEGIPKKLGTPEKPFGDVAGIVEDIGSLNIGEWFNSGEAQ